MNQDDILAERAEQQEDKELEKAIRKIDTVPPRYTVLDYAWDTLSTNIQKRKNELFKHIAWYHTKNLDSLETMMITDYPVWVTGRDDKILFEVTGLDMETMHEVIKNIELPSFYGILKYYIDETRILIVLLIRYFLLKNDKKGMSFLTYYFGYSLYWMAYTTSFKKFNPDQGVVEYTMNNISSKFKIKQAGSVNKWIFGMMNQILTTMEKNLRRGADYDFIAIVDAARTKVGNSMNNLANQIYKNAKEKKYLMTGKMMQDTGEGETIISETNSDTEMVISLATRYTSQFFSTPISEKALKLATTKAEVSVDEVRSTIRGMKDHSDNMEDVQTFYEAVFSIFLESGKYTAKDVKSTQFVAYMNNSYKKGNTVDQNMIKIRNCLLKWLNECSPLYRALTRAPTQSNFRKILYFYMIYVVVIGE